MRRDERIKLFTSESGTVYAVSQTRCASGWLDNIGPVPMYAESDTPRARVIKRFARMKRTRHDRMPAFCVRMLRETLRGFQETITRARHHDAMNRDRSRLTGSRSWDNPESGVYRSAPRVWNQNHHRVAHIVAHVYAVRCRLRVDAVADAFREFLADEQERARAGMLRYSAALESAIRGLPFRLKTIASIAEYLRIVRSLPESRGYAMWLSRRRALAFQGYLLATR